MFVQYLAEHNNKGRPIAACISVSLDNINWIRGGVCLTAKEVKNMNDAILALVSELDKIAPLYIPTMKLTHIRYGAYAGYFSFILACDGTYRIYYNIDDYGDLYYNHIIIDIEDPKSIDLLLNIARQQLKSPKINVINNIIHELNTSDEFTLFRETISQNEHR